MSCAWIGSSAWTNLGSSYGRFCGISKFWWGRSILNTSLSVFKTKNGIIMNRIENMNDQTLLFYTSEIICSIVPNMAYGTFNLQFIRIKYITLYGPILNISLLPSVNCTYYNSIIECIQLRNNEGYQTSLIVFDYDSSTLFNYNLSNKIQVWAERIECWRQRQRRERMRKRWSQRRRTKRRGMHEHWCCVIERQLCV